MEHKRSNISPNVGEYLDGLTILKEGTAKLHIDLASLVALTSIWADPSVHQTLIRSGGTEAWYPNTRRMRRGETRRAVIDGIIIDDNTKANLAIKQATGLRTAKNLATCHVWPKSCYNPNYHTAIANLFLLPAPLASLTDHDPEIEAALKYRSYELYAWHPSGVSAPCKPTNYPSLWRPPVRKR